MRSNGLWIFFFRIKREDRIEPVFKGAIVQIIFFYVPRSLIADVSKGHTVNILCYKNILYNNFRSNKSYSVCCVLHGAISIF